MLAHIIFFLLGDIFLQTFSSLPGNSAIILLCSLTLFLWLLLNKHIPRFSLLLVFVLGFSWSAWYAGNIMSHTLPKEYEGKPLLVTGCVTSLPMTDSNGIHFTFSITSPREMALSAKLTWRNQFVMVKAGDKRQFLVRLKRIHGTQSPGAFDFEAWALQNGLNATGYVLDSPQNILVAHNWYHSPINQIRQFMLDRIKPHLPDSNTSPWLLALILGERNEISQDNWQVLRNTGTNHLMAIAGLHIGMIAGFVHLLTTMLWRRSSRLPLILPALIAGAIAALIAAISYAALAGFSLPAQRACFMLAIYILTLIRKQQMNQWHAWASALIMVLALNPVSVLSESFWLSFGTIALIIYGMSGRLATSSLWWKWGRVQWVVGLGLIPLNLILFQQASMISFIANTIAIPWLAFLILPFCLLGACLVLLQPTVGEILLHLADKSLALLWSLLIFLSKLHIASWQYAIASDLVMLVSIVAFIILLLPAGTPGKWLGIVWLLPLLLIKFARPQAGDFELALLDVGQGLSAVVQTTNHTLVFDAGPKFPGNMDMGESVVMPYLRYRGVRRLDKLVISHGDNDHIGGANAILNSMSVISVETSVPEKIITTHAQYCLAGSEWWWDGVKFSYLYPTRENLHLTNDSSCVLRVENGDHVVLLTGDIEKYAEHDLLSRVPAKLAAQLLVAPHHGSKTSAIPAFVEAVHPNIVLYATGYRNRYHFPHPSVVKEYTSIQALQLNTAQTGSMEFNLFKNHNIYPVLYRSMHKRYWLD